MTSQSSMSATMRISREHFGQSSGSASQTFLMSSRHFAEGILGETLDILTLLRQYPAAPVDIETRMHPATQHPGTLRRKQTLVEEKRDHAGPEQLFQRLEADIGQ